jgi:suppressor of G2 allele of SKP1
MAVEEFTGKYRHQWYQLGNKVVIDVYAKNLPKDAVTVQLSGEDDKLNISIKAQPSSTAAAAVEEDYVLDLHLSDKVSAEAPIKTEVLRTKVEITLVKANTSIHWHTLEKGKGPAAAGVAVAAPAAPQQEQAPPANVRQYPSSKGPKDWSKVEAEVKELEEKCELEDGDPLNNFFKKIYGGADEDTRRAMMKSFVESNGTVLSTNWKEVGAKPVEWKAPEGAEVKKWDI